MHQEFLLRSNLVDKRCRSSFLHCDCIFASLALLLDVDYFSFFQGDMGPQGASGEKGEQGERVMMIAWFVNVKKSKIQESFKDFQG